MNEQVSSWLSAVEGLPEAHERLKRVLILNRPALDVIKQQDGPNTLFYLDPPYLHETRTATKCYGEYEMSETDHQKLIQVLAKIKGKFLLSGYHSKLYDNSAVMFGWNCEEIRIPNNASGAKEKRVMTECVWRNY
jgi:DNA adenine methylase